MILLRTSTKPSLCSKLTKVFFFEPIETIKVCCETLDKIVEARKESFYRWISQIQVNILKFIIIIYYVDYWPQICNLYPTVGKN